MEWREHTREREMRGFATELVRETVQILGESCPRHAGKLAMRRFPHRRKFLGGFVSHELANTITYGQADKLRLSQKGRK